jgi:threonine/homoserine/homoserine lactone efflux protein
LGRAGVAVVQFVGMQDDELAWGAGVYRTAIPKRLYPCVRPANRVGVVPVPRVTRPREPRLQQLDAINGSSMGNPVLARSFKMLPTHVSIVAPMTAEQALAFLVFSTVAAITPGPSNVMLTATGAVAGVLRGLPCLLGVGLGMALMMFLVAFGLGALVLGHPPFITALRWCGAVFLLRLSWKIATAAQGGAQDQDHPVGFVGAFTFQWVNPKSWLVSTSASGTYLQADGIALAQALGFAGLFLALTLICGFVWLAFGVAMRRLLKAPKSQRTFNVGMGVLLACSVLFFVW